MDNKELISVIIPVYNAESTIVDCINSVINQSYDCFEIIAIDDGSTDSSSELLEESAKKDSRIRVIHKKNEGVCIARNLGIETAKGKYLFFLDADDLLHPDGLKNLYNNITEYNGDLSVGDSTSSLQTFLSNSSETDHTAEIWEDTRCLEECLKSNRYTFSIWAKLINKDLIGDSRFTENKKINEDSYFFFLLSLKHPKVVVSPAIVYYYNVTDSFKSQIRTINNISDILYFLDLKEQTIASQYPELLPVFSRFKFNTMLNILENFSATGDKNHKDIENDCLSYVRHHKNTVTAKSRKKLLLAINYHMYPIYKALISKRYTKKKRLHHQ